MGTDGYFCQLGEAVVLKQAVTQSLSAVPLIAKVMPFSVLLKPVGSQLI